MSFQSHGTEADATESLKPRRKSRRRRRRKTRLSLTSMTANWVGGGCPLWWPQAGGSARCPCRGASRQGPQLSLALVPGCEPGSFQLGNSPSCLVLTSLVQRWREGEAFGQSSHTDVFLLSSYTLSPLSQAHWVPHPRLRRLSSLHTRLGSERERAILTSPSRPRKQPGLERRQPCLSPQSRWQVKQKTETLYVPIMPLGCIFLCEGDTEVINKSWVFTTLCALN